MHYSVHHAATNMLTGAFVVRKVYIDSPERSIPSFWKPFGFEVDSTGVLDTLKANLFIDSENFVHVTYLRSLAVNVSTLTSAMSFKLIISQVSDWVCC